MTPPRTCRCQRDGIGWRASRSSKLAVLDDQTKTQRTEILVRLYGQEFNLIPMNAVTGSEFRPSSRERILRFQEILVQEGIQTTVRVTRGADIQAACGQLRSQYLNAAEE